MKAPYADVWLRLPRSVDFVLTLVCLLLLLVLSAHLLHSAWEDWRDQTVFWKGAVFSRTSSPGFYWAQLSSRLVGGLVTGAFWIWCLIRMPRRTEEA